MAKEEGKDARVWHHETKKEHYGKGSAQQGQTLLMIHIRLEMRADWVSDISSLATSMKAA